MPYLLLAPFDDPAILTAILGAGAQAARPARLAGAEDDSAGVLLDVDDPVGDGRLLFYAAVHDALPEPGTARDADGAFVAAQVIRLRGTPLAGQVFGAPLAPGWAEIWREAAPEILDAIGVQDSDQVQARLNQVWSRADSRLRGRAAARVPLGELAATNLRVLDSARPYAKFFTVEDLSIDHDLFGGGTSGPLARAVFVAADAVTVLPYDPVRDTVLVVEQIRPGPVARHDPSPWVPEPVAGRIEPGQTPEAAALRETMEEAGLTLTTLHPVAEYYPSPGAVSEYLYSYIGIADLPDAAAGLGGLASEAEDIRAHVMPRSDLMALIAEGRGPVGTLLLSAFWLELNHARLRQSG